MGETSSPMGGGTRIGGKFATFAIFHRFVYGTKAIPLLFRREVGTSPSSVLGHTLPIYPPNAQPLYLPIGEKGDTGEICNVRNSSSLCTELRRQAIPLLFRRELTSLLLYQIIPSTPPPPLGGKGIGGKFATFAIIHRFVWN